MPYHPPATGFTQIRCLSSTARVQKVTKVLPKKKVAVQQVNKKGLKADNSSKPGSVNDDLVQEQANFSRLETLTALLSKPNSSAKAARYGELAAKAFAASGIPAKLKREYALTKNNPTIIRNTTNRLLGILNKAKDRSSKDERHYLIGQQGSGRSTALLQIVDQALSTGWTVIYLPCATEYINSSSPITYDPETQTFLQPALSRSILQSIIKSNETLKEITVDDQTLNNHANALLDQPHGLSTFLSLLAKSDTPVLLAIDSAQSLFRPSDYLTPDSLTGRIDSFALQIPRILLEYATGQETFKGLCLLSGCGSESAQSRAVDLISSGSKSGYEDLGLYGDLVRKANLKWFKMEQGMSRTEAGGWMRVLEEAKILRAPLGDRMFLQKMMETNGQPEALRRSLANSMASQ